MNKKRLAYSLFFICFAIVLVFIFWKVEIVLSLAIVVLSYLKHKTIAVKKELLWFAVSGIVGTVGESVIMFSGPWSYSLVNVINFPIWLPFLWGLAGIVGISFYQGITSKK